MEETKKSVKIDRSTLLNIISMSIAAISIIIAIIALVIAGASSGGNTDGLKFYPDGHGDYIVAAGEAKYLSKIVIPSTYNGGKVVAIEDEGFSNCYQLTSIEIPDSVVTIGNYAFEGCIALKTVSIGKGVTDIGSYAFSNCSELVTINIPEGVVTLGEYIFANCEKLTNVFIPESISFIGDYAFEACEAIKYNVYENGYYLGNEGNPYHTLISSDNTEITSFAINPATKIVYTKAFYYCTRLETIEFPAKVTHIGSEAFYYCTKLNNIIIPASVKTIAARAFYYCDSLSTVYYTGTEAQLGAIAIDYYNDPFIEAIIYTDYVAE